MIIDRKHVSENVRMQLLREEEHALNHWMEYPSNQLVAARLVLAPPPSGAGAAQAAATAHAHREPAQAADVDERDLHALAVVA